MTNRNAINVIRSPSIQRLIASKTNPAAMAKYHQANSRVRRFLFTLERFPRSLRLHELGPSGQFHRRIRAARRDAATHRLMVTHRQSHESICTFLLQGP